MTTMTNEMEITIRSDDDSMTGGFGWDGYDREATMAAYEDAVEAALRTAYPTATITFERGTYLGDGIRTEDDDTHQQVFDIVTDVFESGSFWVEAGAR